MRHAKGKYLLLALMASLTTGAFTPQNPTPPVDQEEFRDADDWFQSGLAFNSEGKYNDAAHAFGRVISIEPDNAFAWMNLGTMQAVLGDYDKSMESLRKSVRLSPNLAQGYANLGEVCFRAGHFPEAIEAYGRLLEIWPDNAYAHYKRGLAFLFIDQPSRSQEEYALLKNMDGELARQLLHAMEQAKNH
ncbi:tetratricopeptide repeat protein [Geomesophilobacter sediminis]|uniref:Tetratricopeptide repeat protein n=1 Tax=Geomesophilobacter sediminis TaxID=2798584 RepID=A0A8J7JA18_9BACT|nr:tetratricopeptide repeat protein [Geomesophilobacter sediminis]MBJ6723621.1 tetratricopeptide repeat protein [Geomesophilobacter sediminis]